MWIYIGYLENMCGEKVKEREKKQVREGEGILFF